MLLVDALHINDGGGKVLLQYFMTEIAKTNLKVFYLLDSRFPVSGIDLKNVKVLKASLFSRTKFYLSYGNNFSTVFILGNVPPPLKVSGTVLTYLHSYIYLYTPKDFARKEKILSWLKRLIFVSASGYTDIWMVQTENFKKEFKERFRVQQDIYVLPFYPSFRLNLLTPKVKDSFLYVSSGLPHKNHLRLINAFCTMYSKTGKGQLYLTVDKNHLLVINLIESAIQKGYPIYNLGNVSRERLSELYSICEFLVFPSTAESLGLGLIEAASFNCKIIASDLPYVYAACEPSLTFNPYDESSIENAMTYAIENEIPVAHPKLKDCINEIISILMNYENSPNHKIL